MTRITLLAALLVLCLAGSCKKDKKNTTTAKYTFSYSGLLLPNNSIQFTSTAATGSKHTWLFGDGGSSTLAAPTHAYTTDGDYLVKLVVAGGDTVSKYISISDDPGHTDMIGGTRSWHRYYTVASVTDTLDDVSFALTYIDPLTICFGTDTMHYARRSNNGETISFNHTYDTPGVSNESFSVLFNYITNHITLTHTIPAFPSSYNYEKFVSF